MSHTRKISLYAQASLFLLVSSITVSPLFSQDSITTSFAESDINICAELVEKPDEQLDTNISDEYTEKEAKTEFKLSQKDHAQLVAAFQTLITEAAKESKTDKKEAKKLPNLTPAFVFSIIVRTPLIYLYYRHCATHFKENWKNDAFGEIMKLSAVTWLLTEPFKDHTKPYYEYYRDSFDNYINNLFGYNAPEETKEETEAVIAAA